MVQEVKTDERRTASLAGSEETGGQRASRSGSAANAAGSK
jgi:hypothetical protein